MPVSRTIILAKSFDSGMPQNENFTITEDSIEPPTEDGSIQIVLSAVSPDPFLRSRMKSSNSKGSGVNAVGSAIVGFVVGRVAVSNNCPKWAVGDLFGGSLPFKTVQNLSAAMLAETLMWKLTGLLDESNISLGLGILGMPGATVYGGVIDVLKAKHGETIFVSAAAGAVGSMVGMLAKNEFNCTVIGSCGGPEKCAIIREKFGYDYAIDYKTVNTKEELVAKLKEVAPTGIDMYYENVGGIHFEAAYECLRYGGRIAVCGGISGYNEETPVTVTIDPMRMIYPNLRIEGFVCRPWLTGQKGNFLQDMYAYWKQGKIQPQETVFHGLEQWTEAFQALFTGKNVGKVVLYV